MYVSCFSVSFSKLSDYDYRRTEPKQQQAPNHEYERKQHMYDFDGKHEIMKKQTQYAENCSDAPKEK